MKKSSMSNSNGDLYSPGKFDVKKAYKVLTGAYELGVVRDYQCRNQVRLQLVPEKLEVLGEQLSSEFGQPLEEVRAFLRHCKKENLRLEDFKILARQ